MCMAGMEGKVPTGKEAERIIAQMASGRAPTPKDARRPSKPEPQSAK